MPDQRQNRKPDPDEAEANEFLRRASIVGLETAISLMMHCMDVVEVKAVLREELEQLEDE